MTTRVALITGCGKRDGMGRAIANTLAAGGVAVVVTDKQPTGVLNRRQEVVSGADESWGGVDSLVEEITSLGGTAPKNVRTQAKKWLSRLGEKAE